jgi:OFA family oxalate/formate antiporter-like MFS transporter
MLAKFPVPETFRILGILFLVIFIVACFFFRLPSAAYLAGLPSSKKAPASPGEVGLGAALRDPRFWCVALALFFITGTWNILVPIIKPLGMLRGLSETAALLTVMLTGAFNASGRLITGLLSDRIGRAASINLMSVITASRRSP